jgi:serine/threonine-protein kinase RIO1
MCQPTEPFPILMLCFRSDGTNFQSGKLRIMVHSIRREWTDAECERLKALVEAGVSLSRASVVLRRRAVNVQNKARDLGCPFPHFREMQKHTRRILGEQLG